MGRKSKTAQDRYWLERIGEGGGGMYPGQRCRDVPRKVASRLVQRGHICGYVPHNPAHDDRWQITETGRAALSEADKPRAEMTDEEAFEKVWKGKCEVCGGSPTVSATGLCGPCTFGEAETIGGNW